MSQGFSAILKTNVILTLRLSACFLLIAYLSAYLFSPGIFPHTGHDHVDHQQDTCEKDPCHISIYHPGLDGGCNHKFHFTRSPEKCPWCDHVFTYQISPQETVFMIRGICFSLAECHVIRSAPLLIPYCHSGRGPPLQSLYDQS